MPETRRRRPCLIRTSPSDKLELIPRCSIPPVLWLAKAIRGAQEALRAAYTRSSCVVTWHIIRHVTIWRIAECPICQVNLEKSQHDDDSEVIVVACCWRWRHIHSECTSFVWKQTHKHVQAQITSSPEGSQFSIVLAEIVKQDDRPLISGLTHRND